MATMTTVVYIGERLKQLRERKALRQEDLAELAGIGKNTVNRIEEPNRAAHDDGRETGRGLEVDPQELVAG